MFVCFYEFVIKQNVPLRMHQFATAMLEDGAGACTLASMFSNEILNCIRKLPNI
jgi:hypothetical protein